MGAGVGELELKRWWGDNSHHEKSLGSNGVDNLCSFFCQHHLNASVSILKSFAGSSDLHAPQGDNASKAECLAWLHSLCRALVERKPFSLWTHPNPMAFIRKRGNAFLRLVRTVYLTPSWDPM